jgi:translation initiation factor IF-3
VAKRHRPKRTFYRLNHYIQAQEVRVVDEKGKQIGVMPTGEALKQAQEKGLDLVEVAPKAQPPVCKIVDFKKFRYLEAKKSQGEKKKKKSVEIKEIRLTPFMADGDFNFRLQRAEEFLKNGHRLKLSVFFKGRQITKKEFGYEMIKKALEKLGDSFKKDREPRFLGRRLEIMLSPTKGGQDGSKKEKPKEKTKN